MSIASLRRELDLPGPLLSPPEANPKVKKNGKLGVMSWVLHLSPAKESGFEMCPGRSAGCTAACLHFAGNPLYFDAKIAARKRKTIAFVKQRDAFLNLLALEMAAAIKKAKAANMEPAFRLNGTSDIVYEKKQFVLRDEVAAKIGRGIAGQKTDIISLFADVSVYDYTKIPGRNPPENYYLIFSESEDNEREVEAELARGRNIAVVFTGGLPDTYRGRPVIDGDEHDFRPADPKGVVVGLKVKGRGRGETTGFVRQAA